MAQKKPAAAAAKSLKKPAKPQAKTQRAATAVAKTAETVSAKPAAPAKPEKAAPAVNATPPAAAPLLQAVEAAAAKPVQPALRAIDIAVEALASAPKAVQAVKPDQVVAPVSTLLETGAEQARQAYARAQATSEAFRQAVADTATATSRGVIEVNSKVLDAFRAQSDAALDLWRSTLTAGTVADAIRAQTSGTRQVYETTASQWKDIAETTGRWVSAAVKPMQSVWTGQGR